MRVLAKRDDVLCRATRPNGKRAADARTPSCGQPSKRTSGCPLSLQNPEQAAHEPHQWIEHPAVLCRATFARCNCAATTRLLAGSEPHKRTCGCLADLQIPEQAAPENKHWLEHRGVLCRAAQPNGKRAAAARTLTSGQPSKRTSGCLASLKFLNRQRSVD